jgi:hypothetical protein
MLFRPNARYGPQMGVERVVSVHVGTMHTTDISANVYSCFDMTAPIVVAGDDGSQQYELSGSSEKGELALASWG